MGDDTIDIAAGGAGTEHVAPDAKGEASPRPDGPSQAGESGGGAYPNPHSGKDGFTRKRRPDRKTLSRPWSAR